MEIVSVQFNFGMRGSKRARWTRYPCGPDFKISHMNRGKIKFSAMTNLIISLVETLNET